MSENCKFLGPIFVSHDAADLDVHEPMTQAIWHTARSIRSHAVWYWKL